MDFDSFFASPRWKILEIIAKRHASPIEISREMNTSVAYISQQLKLLEAAGLISKEKTGAIEKGKPRSLYSPSGKFAHITVLTKNLAGKKLLNLKPHHEAILKIWLSADSNIHYYAEKLYWRIEEDLEEIEIIAINSGKKEIIVVSESRKVKSKVDSYLKETGKAVNCIVISSSDFGRRVTEDFDIIYSIHKSDEEKLKGGREK